jgi:hypothetical protein
MRGPTRVMAERESYATRAARVSALARAFAEDHTDTAERGQVLSTALATWQELWISREQDAPAISLAPLIYAGIWGDESVAYPLAMATTLLSCGLHLATIVPPYQREDTTLAASSLTTVLPYLAIAAQDAPAMVREALHDTLADRIPRLLSHRMPIGARHRDGEEAALAAMLGAQLAGAAPRVVAACRALGLALGIGNWLAMACADLFIAARCRAMECGIRTPPIALYERRLQGHERRAFRALLGEAKVHATAQGAVRARMVAAGELRQWTSMLKAYRLRAQSTLAEAGLLEPARHQLYTMIAAISISDNTVHQETPR